MKAYREIRMEPKDALAWEHGISAANAALEKGELLAHPTSTVYGLGAAVTVELDAEINRLKGRAPDQPLIRLAGSAETLRRELPAVVWDDRAERLAADFWPGPVTLVLDDGTEAGVAVRVDSHPILLVLLGRWRSLMSSTSLNLEGTEPAADPAAAESTLRSMPEPRRPTTLLSAGSLPGSLPSTIVSLREEPPAVLREGAIDRRRIARCLSESV